MYKSKVCTVIVSVVAHPAFQGGVAVVGLIVSILALLFGAIWTV